MSEYNGDAISESEWYHAENVDECEEEENKYKKMWNTLEAESGYRWCQPHPNSNELLTIRDLMRHIAQRERS